MQPATTITSRSAELSSDSWVELVRPLHAKPKLAKLLLCISRQRVGFNLRFHLSDLPVDPAQAERNSTTSGCARTTNVTKRVHPLEYGTVPGPTANTISGVPHVAHTQYGLSRTDHKQTQQRRANERSRCHHTTLRQASASPAPRHHSDKRTFSRPPPFA